VTDIFKHVKVNLEGGSIGVEAKLSHALIDSNMNIENLAQKVLKRCKVIRQKKDDIVPRMGVITLASN